MEYQSISNLLERFKNILDKKHTNTVFIIDVLKEEINKEINQNNICVKNKIIYVNLKPIFKNQILIKKEVILKKIKDKLNNQIIDIK